MSSAQQEKLVECLLSVFSDVVGCIEAAPNTTDAKLAHRNRNAFKAITYIFGVVVQVADKLSKAAAETTFVASKSKGSKGKGKKEAPKPVEDDDGEAEAAGSEDAFEWQKYREQCVDAIIRALSVDMRKMWAMGLPEEVQNSL